MVSPQNPYTAPEVAAPGTIRNDRGFVPDTAAVAPAPTTSAIATPTPGWSYPKPTYYWGSVIAGTLFAMSIFVLSFLLMLGCHVGVTRAGVLSMGWGAAWWICVTSAIAFYFGGAIANGISRPISSSGWLKGATVWGLSIPLTLCIWGLVAGGSALMAGFGMPHTTIVENAPNATAAAGAAAGVSFGVIWTAFTTLIVGLIFACFGSSSTAKGLYRDFDRREDVIAH